MTPTEMVQALRQDKSLNQKFGQLAHGLKLATERQHFESIILSNPKIAECTIESVRAALLDVAVLGLTLSPAQRLCYLIPGSQKTGNKINGRDEYIQVLAATPSYLGLEQAVMSTGAVLGIQTQAVYDADVFEVSGTQDGTRIRWLAGKKPAPKDRERSLKAVYCIAKYGNGFTHVEVMDAEDVFGCKAAATKKQNGVPFTWTGAWAEEMWKKCVVRRAAKHWPRSGPGGQRLDSVLQIVDKADPMDFSAPEPVAKAKAKPAVPLVDRLTQVMLDGGLPAGEHAKWLKGVAGALGVAEVESIPAGKAEEAIKRMGERITKWKASKAAKEQAS